MIFKSKKSLGQNFLIDKNIIKIISNSVKINKGDTILEVGPGTGNLTADLLLKKPRKLIVIEKDIHLALQLKKKFKNSLEIINEDILKVDETLYASNNVIIFGNLPYNISTKILTKWIKNNKLNSICKKYILMFQKEVADRIIANYDESEYGRLSILSSWRMNIKKIKEVDPKCFFPAPKIKSTILSLEPKFNHFNIKNPKNLEHITNVFFNQRRKMINKPLNILFKNTDEIKKKLNLDLTFRPQNLKPLIYFKLCEEYEKLLK